MNLKMVSIIEAFVIMALIASLGVSMSSQPQVISLSGAGATFPQPLIQKWSEVYYNMTGVQVIYQGIGSGGGIKQFINKTVDFGATDVPMTRDEFTQAPGVLHLPETIGGVVVVYNIPGIGSGLNLTGSVIAQIFGGNITRWSDPQITALNPNVTLPDKTILVCHRSDSSGTTAVFTGFLASKSKWWEENFGAGKVINWPSGTLGGKGNPGVATLVQQNDYSIGYVELSYALHSKPPLTYANIQNAAGEFIKPTFNSLAKAAIAAAVVLPRGDQLWEPVGAFFNLSKVVEKSGPSAVSEAYPITSFSYILVYKELNVIPGMTAKKAQALVWFLWWIIHDGQYYSSALSYVPLPNAVVQLDEATLQMVTFNGEPVNIWIQTAQE